MNYKKSLPWGCMLTAFAIASNIPEEDLIKDLGHNGGERVNDSLYPFRGFHWQEFTPVLLKHGKALICYDLMTPLMNEGSRPSIPAIDYDSVGVLYGQGKRYRHTIVNYHGVRIDPDTGEEPTYDIKPLMYWRIEDVKVQ